MKIILLFHYINNTIGEVKDIKYVDLNTTKNALEFTDYLLENNIQIVQIINSKPDESKLKLINYTPIEKAIMKAIIENAEEISSNGNKITNKRLHEIVNAGLSTQLEAVEIGKACKKLGITSYHANERGKCISSSLIDTFKEAATIL